MQSFPVAHCSSLPSSKESYFPAQPVKIIHLESIKNLICLFEQASLPYKDNGQNTLQLWKRHNFLMLSIHNLNGEVYFIPGSRVHNALQHDETGSQLLHKLEQIGITFYSLSCHIPMQPFLFRASYPI